MSSGGGFLRERGRQRLDPEALLEGGVGVAHGLGQNAEERVGERRAVVLRHPLGQFDQDGGEKGALAEDFEDRFEVAGERLLREFDDIADQFARLEGNAYLGAERDLPAQRFGNLVVKGAIEGDFGNDAGDAGHGWG